MTKGEAQSVIDLILSAWPRTEWPPEVTVAARDAIAGMEVTLEDTKASLLRHRLETAWPMIAAGEAVGRVKALESQQRLARHRRAFDAHCAALQARSEQDESGRTAERQADYLTIDKADLDEVGALLTPALAVLPKFARDAIRKLGSVKDQAKATAVRGKIAEGLRNRTAPASPVGGGSKGDGR